MKNEIVCVFAAAIIGLIGPVGPGAGEEKGADSMPSSIPAAGQAEIAKLIAQLGDKDVNVRDAATKQLVALGETVRAELDKAIKAEGQDAEIIARCGRILKSLPARNVEEFIADLSSEIGEKRVAATRKMLEMGEKALEPLKAAGAKQITPSGSIATRRIDMVYSLIEGFKEPKKVDGNMGRSGYARNSFGITVESGCTLEEVREMGKKYGFVVGKRFDLTSNSRPSGYVDLEKGKDLVEVIKAILSSEPKVLTINLNYVES